MTGGKSYLDALDVDQIGDALPLSPLQKGVDETPIQYLQRTGMNFDGVDIVSDRGTLVETFSLLPQRVGAGALAAPSPHFELTGVNVATSSQSFAENGVFLTTAGALGDQTICAPIAAQTLWANSLAAGLHPLCRFRTNTITDADVRYEVGVRSTVSAFDDGTDNDKMIIRFDSSDGVTSNVNWVLVTSIGGVDTLEDTGIPVVANRDYTFVFAVSKDSNRNVTCFINDEQANDPSLHTLGLVNIGTPYLAAEALAAAVVNWRVQGASRSLTL